MPVSLDSDFYAEKGVMLTEIFTPFGILEVFSTHLMFGGGFGKTGEDAINVATPFEGIFQNRVRPSGFRRNNSSLTS